MQCEEVTSSERVVHRRTVNEQRRQPTKQRAKSAAGVCRMVEQGCIMQSS